jgi:hypothetical protein
MASEPTTEELHQRASVALEELGQVLFQLNGFQPGLYATTVIIQAGPVDIDFKWAWHHWPPKPAAAADNGRPASRSAGETEESDEGNNRPK